MASRLLSICGKFHKVIVVVALLALPLAILALLSPTAKSQSNFCPAANVIFARGSGQKLDDLESARLNEQMEARIPPELFKLYELGSQSKNGHRYPAVNVSDIWSGNALGAWLSAGTSNDYGNSVHEGALELGSYLINIYQQCPDSHIILGGYSQGAQVIGQTIRSLPVSVRDKITFAALFGDPKLNLPEGRGFNPPACRDEQSSPWRRQVPDCNTDNGVLGAREPYIPKDMETKVGLWCLDDDLVCGSSKNPFINGGHGDYKKADGPIDKAAQEIAAKLKHKLPAAKININPNPNQLPTGIPQIMFVFDTSTNMTQEYYSQTVRPTVESITNQLNTNPFYLGTLGVLSYNGCGKSDTIFFFPPKTRNVSRYVTNVKLFKPRCDLSKDLKDTIGWIQETSRIPQSPKNPRVIIVFTNSPYIHSISGAKAQKNNVPYMATLSSNKTEPVLIYPVVPNDIKDSFNTLQINNARVIPFNNPEEIVELNTKNPQLEARLTSVDYQAFPGTTLRFNAGSSLVTDDTITKYEWDFENDGAIDQTTTTATVSRTYSELSTSTVSVRITTASGLNDTATASVRIIDPASQPPEPQPPAHLAAEQTSPTTVKLTWKAQDTLADSWIISINDLPMGRVTKNQLFINISDVKIGKESTYGVQSLTADYKTSERVTIPFTISQPVSLNPQSTKPAPTNIALSPPRANNILEALGSVLGITARSPTVQGKDSAESRLPFALYIIGGIGVSTIVFILSWILYIKLRKKPSL